MRRGLVVDDGRCKIGHSLTPCFVLFKTLSIWPKGRHQYGVDMRIREDEEYDGGIETNLSEVVRPCYLVKEIRGVTAMTAVTGSSERAAGVNVEIK